MNWKQWKHDRIVKRVQKSLKDLVYDDSVPQEIVKKDLEDLKMDVAFFVHFIGDNIRISKENNE